MKTFWSNSKPLLVHFGKKIATFIQTLKLTFTLDWAIFGQLLEKLGLF